MKKTRFFALLLSTLMLLSALSVPGVSADTQLPAAPTVLPNGDKIVNSKTWVDWSEIGVTNAGANGGDITSDGFYKIGGSDKPNWIKDPGAVTADWRGASGLMFYVDTSESTAENKNAFNFILEILCSGTRTNGASSEGCIQFKNSPSIFQTGGGTNNIKVTEKSTAYYYDATDAAWKSSYVSYPAYFVPSANGSGWYYVPFEEIYYFGGSANGYGYKNGDKAAGMNFADFMTKFANQNVWKLSVKSQTLGVKFGDVSFVYPELADLSDSEKIAETKPIFTTPEQNSTEGAGSSTITNGNIVVSGMTGNSATASGNRVWLKGLNNTDLTGAAGIRFHVDTTALGANAGLNVRLRLRVPAGPKDMTNTVYATGKTGGYATSTVGSYMQFVTRTAASVLYYYDNGVAKPLYAVDSTSTDGDAFAALPAGYVGDVYIPMDSFWVSWGSYGNAVLLPWELIAEKYELDMITICSYYTGTAAKDEVTYSNFQVVYAVEETPGDGDQTGGDQTGGDQTGGDQTGGDQTGGDQTGGDQTGGDPTQQTYTVKWEVAGVITEETYNYGDTPSFKGELKRAPDAKFGYYFKEWSPAIKTVTEDIKYSAVWTVVPIAEYTAEVTEAPAPETDPETLPTIETPEEGCQSVMGFAVMALAVGAVLTLKKRTH